MYVIFILLIASLTVASLFLVAFLWSVRTGQWEEGSSPATRILFEDSIQTNPSTKTEKNQTQHANGDILL